MRRLFGTPLARLLAGFCGCLAQAAVAQLMPLDDDELALSTGQAMIEMNQFNNIVQTDGSTRDFTRVTVGGTLEMNALIKKLMLGNYYRPNQSDDPGGDWSCSDECGGEDGTFYWSELVNGLGKNINFEDLPAGFTKAAFADILLENLTLGYKGVDAEGNEILIPAVMKDPYFEIGYDENGLPSFRIGYKTATGVMGNTIHGMSGNIRPTVAINAKGMGLGDLAKFERELDLGGIRTPGYIKDGVTDPLGRDLNDLSPEAQLRPVETNILNNVTDFFISFSASDVLYPEISPGVTAPEAQSGFWMNMDSGLSAATDDYQHPDNYYEGHPIYEALKNIITADGLTWIK
ncbi:hypothetical protein GCM10023116_44480 [Kistimonas scapharcae]|uniref:Uncharacterized protein n=1 Tax=Kistimonas scapharcae TaxID=1036133 RepID=A0ABP8V867_9GAMM